MAALPQFLQQIGAAELPSTVSLPAQEDGTGPIGALLERIQQEITAVNVSSPPTLELCHGSCESTQRCMAAESPCHAQDQTRALLLQEWPAFTDQVQTGQLLLSEVEQEEDELVELEQLMDGEVSPNRLRARRLRPPLADL